MHSLSAVCRHAFRCALLSLLASPLVTKAPAVAAELIRITPDNYDKLVPHGKEIDAIYGDWILRNDHVALVIAQPTSGRNANMTVRNVGGMVIDFTPRNVNSDQLGCFYPSGGRYTFDQAPTVKLNDADPHAADQPRFEARKISLALTGKPVAGNASSASVTYTLEDGARFLSYAVTLTNTSQDAQKLTAQDSIRCDGPTYKITADAESGCLTMEESFYHQCYGLLPDNGSYEQPSDKRTLKLKQAAAVPEMVDAGKSITWSGKLFAAQALPGVRELTAAISAKEPIYNYQLFVHANDGPAVQALVEISRDDKPLGSAYTDQEGILKLPLRNGKYTFKIQAPGRELREHTVEIKGALAADTLTLTEASGVKFSVTDSDGKPIAAKVEFRGLEGATDPNFGPDSSDYGVRNLFYIGKGQGSRPVAPGKYKLIISHGPEYDAATQEVEVVAGKMTAVAVSLPRPVDTTGWISSDFHSHSTPSGDNTSTQLGRVLNLLAEQIDFAPCTEHNRIDTYDEELALLGATEAMATCTGMELTGTPLPLNHQNAFPLKRKPRTQDGGGPVTDVDPVVQIGRLAMWDDGAEKLVQTNHPNIPQMLGDRDLDGKPDGGFRGMLGIMDVIEVHPPEGIFKVPPVDTPPKDKDKGDTIFYWMQLLNLGYRIPGVVNTDAHYNFHGSGWLRNYIASSTDVPSKISVSEMVKASEKGRIIMSTAPFLQAEVRTGRGDAVKKYISGDLVPIGKEPAELWMRVQCANWYDINRVQVFVNGRPLPELNFTRKSHPQLFSSQTVRFEHKVELPALTGDAHIIVATIGEGLTLTEVMGPERKEMPPTAVANPIYLDVDGNGFQPDRDDLGVPFMLDK